MAWVGLWTSCPASGVFAGTPQAPVNDKLKSAKPRVGPLIGPPARRDIVTGSSEWGKRLGPLVLRAWKAQLMSASLDVADDPAWNRALTNRRKIGQSVFAGDVGQ